LFDSDDSGTIDLRELKAAMRALGFDVKKEEARKMLADVNREPTDQITLDDFITMMAPKMVCCSAFAWIICGGILPPLCAFPAVFVASCGIKGLAGLCPLLWELASSEDALPTGSPAIHCPSASPRFR